MDGGRETQTGENKLLLTSDKKKFESELGEIWPAIDKVKVLQDNCLDLSRTTEELGATYQKSSHEGVKGSLSIFIFYS